MMKVIRNIFSAILLIIATNVAASEIKIMALVDNDIVTNIDVNNRTTLLELTGAKFPSEEILEELINEKIIISQLNSLGLSLSLEENEQINNYIDNILNNLESNNKKELKQELLKKLTALKAHHKIIETQIVPYILVTDDEIKQAKRAKYNKDNTSVLVAQTSKTDPISTIQLGWLPINQLMHDVQPMMLKARIKEAVVNPENKAISYTILDKALNTTLETTFKFLKASTKQFKLLNNYDFSVNSAVKLEEIELKGKELEKADREIVQQLNPGEESIILEKNDTYFKFKLLHSDLNNNIREMLAYTKVMQKNTEYLSNLRKECLVEIR